MDWKQSLFGAGCFVAGVVVNQFATYLRERHSQRAREVQNNSTRKDAFAVIRAKMPALIREMCIDLEKNPLVREFVVLEHKGIVFNSSQERFFYYEDTHPDLVHKIAILENEGYAGDVSTGNTPIYRMTEELVDLIRAS